MKINFQNIIQSICVNACFKIIFKKFFKESILFIIRHTSYIKKLIIIFTQLNKSCDQMRSKGQCYVVDIIYLKSETYFEKSNFNKLQNIIDFFSKETIIIFFSNLQSSLVSVSLFVFKSVRVGLFVDKPSLFDIQKNKGLSYEVEHSVSTIF